MFGESPVRIATDFEEPGSGDGASGRLESTDALLVRKFAVEPEGIPFDDEDEEDATGVEEDADALVGMWGSPTWLALGVWPSGQWGRLQFF